MDFKAECVKLSPTHVTKNKKKLKQTTPVPSNSGPSSKSVKAVEIGPERLWRKGFVKRMSF